MPPKKVVVPAGQVGFHELAPDFCSARGRPLPATVKLPRSTSETDLTSHPQTLLKLLSLAEYLPLWFGKISNLAHDAWYLDFFAGPGIYRNGEDSAKGSPVLACEGALALVELQTRRGKTWTPHLRFVEPDPATRKTLSAELARFDGLLDYKITPSTAEAALPGLLAQSAGSPTLAFFDPFGFADVKFEWIRAFRRSGINEVLISFDAQAIKRSVAAGQIDAVTRFSGGDWWGDHVVGRAIDLAAYLHDLCGELRRHFPYASVQQFEFLSEAHAYRAVAQVCGSAVGRDAWITAVKKSRASVVVVNEVELFPGLGDRAVVDAILDRLRPLGGSSTILRDIIGRCSDLECDREPINEALSFLAEHGCLTWTDQRAAAGHTYRLFRFSRQWPATLAWDGVERGAPGRGAPARASSGR